MLRKLTEIRRTVSFFCMLLLLLPLFSYGIGAKDAEKDAVGWYFKKTEDHSQPPLDANLSFIEEHDSRRNFFGKTHFMRHNHNRHPPVRQLPN